MSPTDCENPLAALHYADCAQQYQVVVTENVLMARDTFRVRLQCEPLARQIVPGQFVLLRLPEGGDPLLGRPFALFDTVLDDAGRPIGIDIVYLVVGKMTSRLAQCQPGDRLDIWGPLGNGFSNRPTEHLLMVAGGIGQTPFLALGREFLAGRSYGQPPRSAGPAGKVTLCYGVRNADFAAGVDHFSSCGIEVRISSDDGSIGHHGLVTELVEQQLAQESSSTCRIVCCGPEPMMEAVARLAHRKAVPCEVSLETPMACGIGICFSCVVKVVQPDGGWDYKRTCVEGPVFDAEKIQW